MAACAALAHAQVLMTSFDRSGESDTIEAHEILGEGLRALNELSYLPLPSVISDPLGLAALQENPEIMKIHVR